MTEETSLIDPASALGVRLKAACDRTGKTEDEFIDEALLSWLERRL